MKAKRFLTIAMLVGLAGLIGGCHELARDDHRSSWYRGYGYNDSGSYRDGFRDGRTYQRQRDESRYDRDYYGRRW